MATVPKLSRMIDNGYPTWSPEPMPETDLHRNLMLALIDMLQQFYAGQQVYISGNLLIFYVKGDRRKHISPDVWLARGVEMEQRPNYLIWEEPRGPEFIVELTSATTATEDQTTKLALYRDVLKVREYFLFDPLGDYLDPQLQGYRLRGGAYQRIHERNGRLPSQVTGLHLEMDGDTLRLWNPQTEEWLPTRAEAAEARADAAEAQVEEAHERADVAVVEAEAAVAQAEAAEAAAEAAEARAQDEADRRRQAEGEIERLRQQIEQLRQQPPGS